MKFLLQWVSALALGLGIGSPAQAQTWPSHPIKIIVAFAPGGAADLLARIIAAPLQEALGQPVLVENKTGAGGNLGANEVAKATPDGYTFLMGSGGIVSINPHLYKTMLFDPAKDLVPVASVARVPLYLAVRADTPITDFAKLVADMKANAGLRAYGSAGIGTSPHIGAEMMLSMTQTKAKHVPYRGVSAALNDLLGGQFDFLFDSGAALQYAKSGKLRILAVGSLSRAPQAPDVPTLDELGLKGFDGDTVFGLYAPAGTPQTVIARINSEVNRLLRSGPTKERIEVGGQLPQPMTQTEFARKGVQDFERFGSLIRTIGIRAE